MKRVLYLATASILLLIVLSACEAPGGSSGSTPTPTSVPTATTSVPTATTSTPTQQPTAGPGVNQELTEIATQYYTFIKARNYTRAYTYLAPQATDANGQIITQQSFEQQARAMDSQEGAVVSFSISAFTPMVVATVTRSQMGPYHAHLQMKQEGNTWKIVSLDRI